MPPADLRAWKPRCRFPDGCPRPSRRPWRSPPMKGRRGRSQVRIHRACTPIESRRSARDQDRRPRSAAGAARPAAAAPPTSPAPLRGPPPNRLTVARELCCLPRRADARKAELDIASRWVEELRDRFPTGTRYLQIARHVVHEEILEDVGTGVAPSRLASLPHTLDQPRVVARPLILGKQMLVRVHQFKRADLKTKIGLRLHR